MNIIKKIRRKHTFERALRDWYEEREHLFAEMYFKAKEVCQLPKPHRFLPDKNGLFYYEGQILNTDTLVAMVEIERGQESARQQIVKNLQDRLSLLESWEASYPIPVYRSRWPWRR